mmetsp:Transcript_36210/g.78800  ORF Transcript_36210/g.78800 Transcript_36210/m.78800 type:complete len:219 (+) Transcript_36210:1746-2402(+)
MMMDLGIGTASPTVRRYSTKDSFDFALAATSSLITFVSLASFAYNDTAWWKREQSTSFITVGLSGIRAREDGLPSSATTALAIASTSASVSAFVFVFASASASEALALPSRPLSSSLPLTVERLPNGCETPPAATAGPTSSPPCFAMASSSLSSLALSTDIISASGTAAGAGAGAASAGACGDGCARDVLAISSIVDESGVGLSSPPLVSFSPFSGSV